jgi:hypothetical protein
MASLHTCCYEVADPDDSKHRTPLVLKMMCMSATTRFHYNAFLEFCVSVNDTKKYSVILDKVQFYFSFLSHPVFFSFTSKPTLLPVISLY